MIMAKTIMNRMAKINCPLLNIIYRNWLSTVYENHKPILGFAIVDKMIIEISLSFIFLDKANLIIEK